MKLYKFRFRHFLSHTTIDIKAYSVDEALSLLKDQVAEPRGYIFIKRIT